MHMNVDKPQKLNRMRNLQLQPSTIYNMHPNAPTTKSGACHCTPLQALGLSKNRFWRTPGGPDNGMEILGECFLRNVFSKWFCKFLIGVPKKCWTQQFFLYTTPLSAAKVRCANFGQFLYWPVTRCVWAFFLIGLLGVKPTGKSTEAHKKSRGPRTMNEVKTGCQRGWAGVRHKVTDEGRLPISRASSWIL